jgi:hypothetical protein
MSKKEARRPEPSCFFGGALSAAVEPYRSTTDL